MLFRQRRAGRGGVPFAVLKFRTLRDGPGDDAARMTRTGRVLRALALDELPQLVNVLRGEMSLVGPRPLPSTTCRCYTPRQALRLRVRPGLAGLAQAAGRNAAGLGQRGSNSMPAMPRRRRRCARDLALLLRCGALALAGRGAPRRACDHAGVSWRKSIITSG